MEAPGKNKNQYQNQHKNKFLNLIILLHNMITFDWHPLSCPIFHPRPPPPLTFSVLLACGTHCEWSMTTSVQLPSPTTISTCIIFAACMAAHRALNLGVGRDTAHYHTPQNTRTTRRTSICAHITEQDISIVKRCANSSRWNFIIYKTQYTVWSKSKLWCVLNWVEKRGKFKVEYLLLWLIFLRNLKCGW